MGLLFLGIILLYVALQHYTKTNKLISRGVKTTATVTRLIEIDGDDGYTYKAVFEFEGRNSTNYQLTSAVSSNPPMYKIGDRVKVVYNPNDPEEVKMVSFWGLYRWSVVLLSIACPLIIIGGGYLLYARG